MFDIFIMSVGIVSFHVMYFFAHATTISTLFNAIGATVFLLTEHNIS